MNNEPRKIRARFAPQTRFEVSPMAGSPYRAEVESRFETLKRQLLDEKLDALWDTRATSHLRRAANEAASLAWITPYPLLVFPELFAEKVNAAVAVAERQDKIRRHSRELLFI